LFNIDYFKNVKKNIGRGNQLDGIGAANECLWADLSNNGVYYSNRSDVLDTSCLIGLSNDHYLESWLQAKLASWLPSRSAALAQVAIGQCSAPSK
jgi:hypothetical protein